MTPTILAGSPTLPADDAPEAPAKRAVDLPVLYFGTPVVMIGSLNDDGTTNVAPMSSAWWLGETTMLGMSRFSRTVQNLERRPQVVLSLADSALVDAVDRIALLAGRPDVPEYKRRRGYTWCANKFAAGGMTPEAVPETDLQAVAEAPVHLLGEVVTIAPIGGAGSNLVTIEVRVQQSWVREGLLLEEHPGHMDPLAIRAATDTRNGASARVLEKLGLVREGTLREDCVVNGEVSDSWVYGLLRRQWRPSGKPASTR